MRSRRSWPVNSVADDKYSRRWAHGRTCTAHGGNATMSQAYRSFLLLSGIVVGVILLLFVLEGRSVEFRELLNGLSVIAR